MQIHPIKKKVIKLEEIHSFKDVKEVCDKCQVGMKCHSCSVNRHWNHIKP